MPESGTYGSVRGAGSNPRPYRDLCQNQKLDARPMAIAPTMRYAHVSPGLLFAGVSPGCPTSRTSRLARSASAPGNARAASARESLYAVRARLPVRSSTTQNWKYSITAGTSPA